MTARHARRTRRAPHVPPAVLRAGARLLGQRCLDPALPWEVQRTRLDQLTRTSLLPRGTVIADQAIAGRPAEVITGRSPGSAPPDSAPPDSAPPDSAPPDSAPPDSAPPDSAPPDSAPSDSGQLTVLHFHGGGYCIGSAFMARSWAAHLAAATGARVVLPVYRLAPEHPHPAALDDARAVWAELSAQAGPGSIVVSGDSAGGGLALALMLSLRDAGQDLPVGAILLSPWLDLGRDRRADPDLVRRDVLLTPGWLEACARAYAKPAAWPDPLVSPLNAAHAGLPRLLIQAGTDELLAPDAALLAASAAAAGVDVTYTSWPRSWHDFVLQPGLLAAADSALAQAAWFVRQARECDLRRSRYAASRSGCPRTGRAARRAGRPPRPHRPQPPAGAGRHHRHLAPPGHGGNRAHRARPGRGPAHSVTA
jgi:epsilon-lactone hydrolase